MVRLAIAERRELLIAAAWRVMTRDGIAATTTRAICAEAQMPQSAFHYCFDTRGDLLRIVVANQLPKCLSYPAAAVDGSRDALQRITDALGSYWQDVVHNTALHTVLFDVTLHAHYDSDLGELAKFQHTTHHAATREVLQDVVADGRFRWDGDLDEIAVGVVAFLDGLTLRYIVDPQNETYDAVLAAYAQDLSRRLVAL